MTVIPKAVLDWGASPELRAEWDKLVGGTDILAKTQPNPFNDVPNPGPRSQHPAWGAWGRGWDDEQAVSAGGTSKAALKQSRPCGRHPAPA